jgi:predicted CoA-substrate-specific enzyme activase
MTDRQKLFVGIDAGASRIKVAVLDGDARLIGRSVVRPGIDFAAAAGRCLNEAMGMAGRSTADIGATMATGYGRKNIRAALDSKTEISCHARGCYHYFPMAITIIDIGGQDNKVIKLDDAGRRLLFKMNRKCAAGTGAFLEEMALRMEIPLDAMDALARKSTQMVELGSYCTVFTATEVLEKIRLGKKIEDIVKGLFASVIKRVMEMDTLSGQVVMTGGVAAHNPFMIDMMQEMLGRPVRVPEFPQFTGAVGAALFAMEHHHDA